MPDRTQLAAVFLAGTPFADAERGPLAGDASNRRYERLLRPDGSRAVLMDAPPEKGEDVRPFVLIARHLTGLGLSAPAIMAEDAGNGFLLIEDLGDDLYSRLLASMSGDERQGTEFRLYAAATDMLARLSLADLPDGVADYSPELMSDLAGLAYVHYRKAGPDPDEGPRAAFLPAMRQLLDAIAPQRKVLIMRDVHAENLLWLPRRKGVARVGLLDFQDAMSGHPAYDLVSLLQDARRDVPRALHRAMIARFCAQTGANLTTFSAAYHVLGVQRNLRILGVFARLSLLYGKPHYVDLIPRVWDNLVSNLSHPALLQMRRRLLADLPEPTPALLQKLKDRCGTLR